MRRAAVVALALVVAGGLWLSASSTLALGERHGVPPAARPALVVVLEVAAVIGTALWVTAPRGERRDPAVVVIASSAVAAIGGWAAYGWVGVLGPAATVFVAHMVAKRWGDLDAARNAEPPVVGGQEPPTEVDEAPAGPPTPPTGASRTDEDIVAALVARPALPGRDAVKSEFSVGTKRAERVLEAAAAHRRPHLVTAEEATS